ncbi:hypothetical protein ENH_00003530 [Eimeria necatrix]|uniref:Uncharacterized protein n=1 Tax=Eimeria necatrix TaxID=51315 RepID=U6MLG0_9EIME|nr:hypothetical protein ENH_00003530 [Eimeria necatrix]CDJ65047.1 hypothetical protein ENH_00003530 [Eimeria necatrix]
MNKYRAASVSRFASVSSLDQQNEESKPKEQVAKIGPSTITETQTTTQSISCHKPVGTPTPFSPSRQRVAKRRNTAAVAAAAAAATAGTADIAAASAAAEVIFPGEATNERLISATDVPHNLHSSLYFAPTVTTQASETGGAATSVAATMTPTPGVVAAAAAPSPIAPAASDVAVTTAAAAPMSTAAVADSGDLCWMISDLTSSWTRPDCFTSCDSIFGREGEGHIGTSTKSDYDCLESNGVAGSLHTGVMYTSRSDDSGNSGFSDDFYNFGSSSFGSRLIQGVGGEHTPKDELSSSVWSSFEVANEENREEYKCTQQVLNSTRDRSQSILCCGLPTGPTTGKRKICNGTVNSI